MRIAPATIEDSRAIAQVQVVSWQHAYEGLLPADYLRTLDVASREAQWRYVLQHQRAQVLLALVDGVVQGFIAYGPSRDADTPPGRAEIWAFYLAPLAWSQGWGRQLWLAARAQLQAQGYASVSLWVLAGNRRAILFYAKAGFAPEPGAARDFTLGGAQHRELCCVCRIDQDG